MNKENTTLGTTSIQYPNFNITYCQYRLPCGYCEKLGRDCPKSITYNPWDPNHYNPLDPTITSVNDNIFYTNTTALGGIYTNNLDKEKK